MLIARLLAKHETKLRFGLVGVLNTAVDFGLYVALSHWVGLPIVIANFFSTSAGFTVSFFLNRRFTFNSQNARKFHEFLRFLSTTLVGLWVLQPVVIYIIKIGMTGHGLPGLWLVTAPKLAAIAVGLVWNYWWYSRFVFAERPSIKIPAILQHIRHQLFR